MYDPAENDRDPAPSGSWEDVPGTNISVLGAVLFHLGAWVGKGLLAVGLVCFLLVAVLLAASGGSP
jgi:hypothetical protein